MTLSANQIMEALTTELPPHALEAFCKKWRIRELALFGSALRGDFRPDSDLDLLVTFDENARWSLWDVIGAEQELSQIAGRPVDLVERSTIENSENWIRRNNILATARTIYER